MIGNVEIETFVCEETWLNRLESEEFSKPLEAERLRLIDLKYSIVTHRGALREA
jgi:hypothetical protein